MRNRVLLVVLLNTDLKGFTDKHPIVQKNHKTDGSMNSLEYEVELLVNSRMGCILRKTDGLLVKRLLRIFVKWKGNPQLVRSKTLHWVQTS